MVEQEHTLQQAAELVDAAQRMVFFTGAGISTESGIPDFRSPGTGLWNRMKPIAFQDFIASDSVRQESWRRRFTGDNALEKAAPNAGHSAIEHLVSAGRCIAVITQNVDNLHQNSGVPADKVVELHGNATYASCLSCQQHYTLESLREQFRSSGHVEPCASCGGIIKSATISFGQAMPPLAMEQAQSFSTDCDLMIVAGSSLAVYPAAAFPEVAKQSGARLLIINREATPLDPIADCVLHAELGSTLSFLARVNEG